MRTPSLCYGKLSLKIQALINLLPFKKKQGVLPDPSLVLELGDTDVVLLSQADFGWVEWDDKLLPVLTTPLGHYLVPEEFVSYLSAKWKERQELLTAYPDLDNLSPEQQTILDSFDVMFKEKFGKWSVL